MTEIIFLVDDIDPATGAITTATDRLRSISPNWQPNLYDENKAYYQKYMGGRIKFARVADVTSYDPSKRYFYFIPLNDWHCTMQQFFFMLPKEKLLEFAQNNVGFYFCQDFEMYPNMEINFLGNYLGWVRLIRDAHAFPQIPMYFAMCSELCPKHKFALRRAFQGQLNFVMSPMIVKYTVDELQQKLKTVGMSVEAGALLDDYLGSPKQKLYTALTRDPKYHRLAMMHGLRANGLLDKGYVSHLIQNSYNSSAVAVKSSEYAQRVVWDMDNNGPMPYMEVDDVEPTAHARSAFIQEGIGGVIPLDQMVSSCYDLVQETSTRYDVVPYGSVVDMAVVTEKLIKSLIFARPFVVNGGPGCLRVIRRWGFETCGYLFDESYDELEHFVDRQEVIVRSMLGHARDYGRVMSMARDNRASLERNSRRALDFPIQDVLADAILRPWA